MVSFIVHIAWFEFSYVANYSITFISFSEFFSVLSGLMSSVKVEVIYRDIESTVIEACRTHVSQARVQECFFHLCRSVYRKLYQLGCKRAIAKTKTLLFRELLLILKA